VVAFVGRPSDNGPANIYTDQKGIFTVVVDVIVQSDGQTIYRVHKPEPVIQVGDTVLGRTITDLSISNGSTKDLALFDPLAPARTDDYGNSRTQHPGDHRIVFWASTDQGAIIFRGSHTETSEDGLLDHWKTKGIDFNGDGTIDLDLPSLGANAQHKD